MTPTPECPTFEEERLDEILGAYLEAADTGEAVDRRDLFARHPDLADRLAAFFDGHDHLERVTMPLRPGAPPMPGFPPPFEFRDYEILEPLGQGGMGVVYKARQKSLNRLVALKMIRTGWLASPDQVRRFRNEAETVATLDHPRVVPIYDVGEEAGHLYYSMKWIEGGSLAEHLPRFTADPRAAVQVLVAVARAVHHAHQRGILHRDLKPSNILLDADGRPHVADFGLAKSLELDQSLTQTGALLGTPSYMAPEQASPNRNNSPAVTTATDVHGLGAILYALLTGRPPFNGDNVLDTLEQVRSRDPQSIRASNPNIDRDLETVCLKCLEKDPERRYESAEALARDLERWQVGKPVHARPVRQMDRAWRWCQRNKVLAGLSAAVIALIVAALVGLPTGMVLLSNEQARTKGQKELAESMRDLAQNQGRQLRRQLYAGDISLAFQSWQILQIDHMRALLDRHTPKQDEEDLRGFEWRYLDQLLRDGTQPLRVMKHGSPVYDIAMSLDGKRVASCGENQVIRLWDVATGIQIGACRSGETATTALAISPDGKTLASGSGNGEIRLWDVPSLNPKGKAFGHNTHVIQLIFSPDGQFVVSGSKDRTIKIWSVAKQVEMASLAGEHPIPLFSVHPQGQFIALRNDFENLKLWEKPFEQHDGHLNAPTIGKFSCGGEINYPAFNHRGDQLALPYNRGNVSTFDLRTRSFTGTWPADPDCNLGYAPDDESLILINRSGQIRIWNMATQTCVSYFQASDRFDGVAVSADGRTLAAGSWDGNVYLWDFAKPRYPVALPPAPKNITKVCFPIGELGCLAQDGVGLVHALNSNDRAWREAFTLPADNWAAWTISRDGQTVAFIDKTGKLYRWDTRQQETPELFETPEALAGDSAISPDGHHVVASSATGALLDCDLGTKKVRVLNLDPKLQTGRKDQHLRFSPDGTRLALYSPSVVLVFDFPSLELIFMQDRSRVGGLEFSPNGRLLAVVSPDQLVDIVDSTTGALLQSLTLGSHPAHGIAFSPDNRTMAIAGGDAVKLWHVPTGQQMLTLHVDRSVPLAAVSFSADGRTLLAMGGLEHGARTFLWKTESTE
jgi:WD40 repeat protein/tRNA A-37 threonylcarbamoyl transferase component Bud32